MSADYSALATLILLAGFLLYYYIVYPFLLSPLAKIPNAHWTSPFLPWWILWKTYQQLELAAAYEAHQRFGLIVRLGPKDLELLPQKRLTTDTGNRTRSAVLQNRIIRSTGGESPQSTPNLRFSTLHN